MGITHEALLQWFKKQGVTPPPTLARGWRKMRGGRRRTRHRQAASSRRVVTGLGGLEALDEVASTTGSGFDDGASVVSGRTEISAT